MTLEQFIASLSNFAFWKEFTFSRNKFQPGPGSELELADNLVWLGDCVFALQLKERQDGTDDPETERLWFKKKVIGKATRQIRDTMRYLSEYEVIQITNERDHIFSIRQSEISELIKIVVFASHTLPEDCRHTRYHNSRSAGFMHILAAQDYLVILETLRVPEDIRRYFSFREQVAPKLRDVNNVGESDIVGAFLVEQEMPNTRSHERLYRFVQDLDQFDLSPLIGNLHEHIQCASQPYDYYKIMLEFARVPRSVWREVKIRLVKSLGAVQKMEFTQPFRLTFLATSCTFMIAPLDPEIPSKGAEGEKTRIKGLTNLTYAATYDAKTSKGIGILVSKDGEYIQIDWSFLEMTWELDPQMESRLSTRSPFRNTAEKRIDNFLLLD